MGDFFGRIGSMFDNRIQQAQTEPTYGLTPQGEKELRGMHYNDKKYDVMVTIKKLQPVTVAAVAQDMPEVPYQTVRSIMSELKQRGLLMER